MIIYICTELGTTRIPDLGDAPPETFLGIGGTTVQKAFENLLTQYPGMRILEEKTANNGWLQFYKIVWSDCLGEHQTVVRISGAIILE